jgi:hypothetical protein
MAYALKMQQELLDMLSVTRPHQSKAEEGYIREFIEPWTDYTDSFGNLHKTVMDGDKKPIILFSSHTDTVHRKGGLQNLSIHKHKVVTSDSTCLGADDAVGNYLMISMIERGIPGKYIFHRGEEHGGLGSSHIATQTPEVLDDIDFAIALDRKGNNDVIQYQNGGRCCSKEFASDLATLLGMTGGDPHGTFTDTANYVSVIPECTNISVAYWDQHSKQERCDLIEIANIESSILCADWSTLKAYPFEPEFEYDYSAYYSRYGNINVPLRSSTRVGTSRNDKTLWDLHDLCVSEPYEVAWFLKECGVSKDDVLYTKRPSIDTYNTITANGYQTELCLECGYMDHPGLTCLEYYNEQGQ